MSYFILKRIFDFNLALFGIILFCPLIILITIAILLEDGPPIFYDKKSLGRSGRVFGALKFRSMKVNSLAITKVGKLLRQTALDELSQLINIAKGEMSFVGPRPYGIEKYNITPQIQQSERVDFTKRLEVIPGLTGLAQVFAPKHASAADVLIWDLRYIKEKNFMLDLYIIILSVYITLRRNWERIDKKI